MTEIKVIEGWARTFASTDVSEVLDGAWDLDCFLSPPWRQVVILDRADWEATQKRIAELEALVKELRAEIKDVERDAREAVRDAAAEAAHHERYPDEPRGTY